jgi:hypothetical protein
VKQWTKQAKQEAKQQDQNSIIDDDIDKERILYPVIKCSSKLREFRTQIIKLYNYPDENDWNFQFNTFNTAKKILKAERYLNKAHQVLSSRHS